MKLLKKCAASFVAAVIAISSFGQVPNWQNKDLQKDSFFGISTDRAYSELLKNKKSKTVLVAVIDGGVDTTHQDLKQILWTNPREKSGNGKDDDKNGYTDDIHGWNFIGGKNGCVQYDNLELTRIMRRDMDFYDSLSMQLVPLEHRTQYQTYISMRKRFDRELFAVKPALEQAEDFKITIDSILIKIGKNRPTAEDFENYQTNDPVNKKICNHIIRELKREPDFKVFYIKAVMEPYSYYKKVLDYHLNVKYDPRPIVNDNYNNSKEQFYGNNDVSGPDGLHGTHVAGLIGALRNNNIGVNGVADNVCIMSIRTVPDGDERDKDVANAIKYAVDNGAKIINMSFGKAYSWDKKIVDDAVKYAMSKDVLLIHAAGNDHKDLDANDNFPNRWYADSSGEAKSWIEVGASGSKDDNTLVANFSNYGKTTVDVFAPGVHIYSTVPGNKYEYEDGTSMAAPVVTGLAALIREYYPKLTAVQVKEIILQSVIKRDALKDKCVSGGVVNAYNALKLAAKYK